MGQVRAGAGDLEVPASVPLPRIPSTTEESEVKRQLEDTEEGGCGVPVEWQHQQCEQDVLRPSLITAVTQNADGDSSPAMEVVEQLPLPEHEHKEKAGTTSGHLTPPMPKSVENAQCAPSGGLDLVLAEH